MYSFMSLYQCFGDLAGFRSSFFMEMRIDVHILAGVFLTETLNPSTSNLKSGFDSARPNSLAHDKR